jgi:uncharacterized protein (TIGR02145 family)
MKRAIKLLTLFMVVLLLFSCRNKSGKNFNKPESSSAQTTSDSGENKNNTGVKPVLQVQEKVKDIEGNVYNTVKIGNQTWMVKNLKATKYNDGTSIPLVTDGAAWAALTTPGYCWYDNEASSFKPSYGALYNGYAVSTGKLCPTGWHVPSDEEWTTLTTWLGGESFAGDKLKETGTSFWVSPNTGATNESGYTALPGGLRYFDGLFHDFGFSGYWWSSTEYSTTRAYFRYMDYEYDNVFRFNNLKKIGFSVRCLRDY